MDQIDSRTLRSILVGICILVIAIGVGIWLYSTGKIEYVWLNPSRALWVAFFFLIVALAALAFVLFQFRRTSVVNGDGKPSSPCDQIESRTLQYVVIGAGVLVSATFVWAGFFVGIKSIESEVALPVVIIAGLVVLIIVLGLLTFVFSVLKLSDSKEALGLPSGSIRAVIALMLLVIFAIVAIFLYSDISSNSKFQTLLVKAEQVEGLKKSIDYVADVDELNKYGKPTGNKTVYYRAGSKAAEDLAKQLIVLLGTLVTAVSSFYFGANSIAAAKKVVENIGGPNAKSVDPSNLPLGGKGQRLKISGTNLGNVIAVKLTRKDEKDIPANADVVGASEAGVECKIDVPDKASFGPWTVVVTDNTNNDSRIPDSVTLGERPSVDTKPKPEKVDPDPTVLTAGKPVQSLKIIGTNLGKVSAVTLKTAGQPDIAADANSVKPAPTEVNCTMTVLATAVVGPRDVVLTDDAKNEATLSGKVTIAKSA